jgi:hypothetical protein
MKAAESISERCCSITPQDVYAGSDAAATRSLYAKLEARGPIGIVALNLFRAQKCSARAKVYHGGIPGKGTYARMAYERKTWSLGYLCHILLAHWLELRITWGWKHDPQEPYASWILYVDLPQGQVSFHNTQRLTGPEYYGNWDGRHASEERIIAFCEEVLLRPPIEKNLTLF